MNITSSSCYLHNGGSSNYCQIEIRQNCNLPEYSGKIDYIMCIFFAAALITTKVLEVLVKNRLDEAIQTTQDYSIVVNDPDPDAADPDEWMQFFSRFGEVRYAFAFCIPYHLLL
jgi:hypothetical protein